MIETQINSDSENQPAPLDELRSRFRRLAETASEACDRQLGMTAAIVTDLLTSAQMLNDESAEPEVTAEILQFCSHEASTTIAEAADDDVMLALREQIEERWGHCLSLLEPAERCPRPSELEWDQQSVSWQQEAEASEDSLEVQCIPSNITDLLASLTVEGPGAEAVPAKPQSPPAKTRASSASAFAIDSPPKPEVVDDPELAAAFSDDAQQCLAEMESSLLDIESGDDAKESRRNFCRQLHTLKGASGTVGLTQLAGYLHELESYVESSGDNIDVDQLLNGVDAVRAQLSALAGQPASGNGTESDDAAAAFSSAATTAGESELFVRVEASRLERLMDLLAELVVLRNRRDNDVESLKAVHSELANCSTRVRLLTTPRDTHQFSRSSSRSRSAGDFRQASSDRLVADSLVEISKDTAELARSLQSVFDPLAADNSAVSHLIGLFRQELMELRRLPVNGLFQRLQRAVRDAANAEQKQVEVILNGQGARAERAIQDRLFEPLLHLVRNAVSHGVQRPHMRTAAGKAETGQITLSAWSDASTLSIEVRDDGNGLDNDALEARGRALGLLPAGEKVDQQQLWKLIFHPGFSTKANVSEISGRGVGMDVVDRQIRRLRGRITVDSTPGKGTTFLLQIPLRSAVEHAMIVQCNDQLFALPLHAVSGTSDSGLSLPGPTSENAASRSTPLSSILGYGPGQTDRCSFVSLRSNTCPGKQDTTDRTPNVTVSVDAIVGVEEVVVRSLPPLLQQHELLAGITLSGRAETVLLLDASQLVERIAESESETNLTESARTMTGSSANPPRADESSDTRCFLVVDDSVAVRRALQKKLQDKGHFVRTANNGRQALDLLRAGGISAVVTDVDMPIMNGAELLQEIRSNESLRSIPVAVLSSRGAEMLPPKLMDAGPQITLEKPVTDKTVLAITEEFARALNVN